MTDSGNRRFHVSAEALVAIHVSAFLVGVSWAFGGNAQWVRTPISIWGSLGIVLTIYLIASRESLNSSTLWWAVPIALLNLLVAVACLTPGFHAVLDGAETFLLPVRIPWWLPSSARPDLALGELWLFDGIYFSCLNVALAVRRRAVLRGILVAVAANGLLLAIFGTIQKLSGSRGIYFGSVKSPQDYFFASFVYDNHWGAFMIIVIAGCVGLVMRCLSGSGEPGFLRGPGPSGLVAAAVMAITVPLSGARACTILLGILAAAGFAKAIAIARRAGRGAGSKPAAAYFGMAVFVAAVAWGAWAVAGEVIDARLAKTKEQVSAAWQQGGIGDRAVLYRDTWRMARDRPLFGWGMASYPSVFALYNTQKPHGDRIPVVYHDAHSDWLQSVSEIGPAGTVLVGLSVILPCMSLRGRKRPTIAFFLFFGCALVAAYAWVEFPFGNVAVVLAWWLSFMVAAQYTRLSDAGRPA